MTRQTYFDFSKFSISEKKLKIVQENLEKLEVQGYSNC